MAILVLMSCQSPASEQSSTNEETQAAQVDIQKPPFEDIDVAQFKKMMSQPDVVLIDVRTPGEVADGKIEGALEINIKDASFEQKIQELDKNKTYLVYCAAGVRSAKSCNKMADMGFPNLYNLKGGYGAWSNAQ